MIERPLDERRPSSIGRDERAAAQGLRQALDGDLDVAIVAIAFNAPRRKHCTTKDHFLRGKLARQRTHQRRSPDAARLVGPSLAVVDRDLAEFFPLAVKQLNTVHLRPRRAELVAHPQRVEGPPGVCPDPDGRALCPRGAGFLEDDEVVDADEGEGSGGGDPGDSRSCDDDC